MNESDSADDEAEPWLQERAWDELAQFLRTWLSIEEAPALNRMRNIVQKFRSIATYVHKSPKAKAWLENTQKEKLKVDPLRVKTDCPTRWNSAKDMLVRMIMLKEPLTLFFSYIKTSEGKIEFKDVTLKSPSPSDWFAINCLVALLEPFASATEELSGSEYPTLSVALPCLRYIKRWLKRTDIFEKAKARDMEHSYTRDILDLMNLVRRALLNLFEKRFEQLPSGMLWVSLLDPRLTGMDALDESERIEAKAQFLEAAIEMAAELFPIQHPAPAHPTSSPMVAQAKKARSSLREGVFGKRAARKRNQPLNREEHTRRLLAQVHGEINEYFSACALMLDGIDREDDGEDEPLVWWKRRSISFPILAQLARKWLGCVATSVPSERVFSSAGNIVAAKRSSLDPSIVRDLVFIHENYADSSH